MLSGRHPEGFRLLSRLEGCSSCPVASQIDPMATSWLHECSPCLVSALECDLPRRILGIVPMTRASGRSFRWIWRASPIILGAAQNDPLNIHTAMKTTITLLGVCLTASLADKTCEKAQKYLDTCTCECKYPTIIPDKSETCDDLMKTHCPLLEDCCEDCYPYLEMYLDTCILVPDGCSCENFNGECAPGDESCLAAAAAIEEEQPPRFTSLYGTTDMIWLGIEEVQGEVPFGDVLDAGTGRESLKWLSRIQAKSLTAVTASETMKQETLRTAEEVGVENLQMVLGNWFGDEPINFDKKFDTILADYLIGAISGFADYYQEMIIPKLVEQLKPGGYLYIIGWEPIPLSGLYADQHIISSMRIVRDTSIMMVGELYYREYPLEWVERQIANTPNCELTNSTKYSIWYGFEKIKSQLDVGRQKLPKFPSKKLARAMRELIDDIEEEARWATTKNGGTIYQGFDYVVAVRKNE